MYRLSCDNPSCAAEISTGAGQPALLARENLYCTQCAAYVAQVESQLRTEMTQHAVKSGAEFRERRAELMARIMPANRGGTGEGIASPMVVPG